MAKIVDPDDLTQGTEVTFDTAQKTITVSATGSIVDIEGVTLQCIYSFCKEEWKDDSDLIKYPFPLIAITAEQFELFNGWDWADETSKQLIRDGGWALKDGSGVSQEEYMNITTLGSFNANTDNSYYLQSGTTSVPTVYPAEVNQAIKIYGDSTYGNFDYRDTFNIYLREQAKLYDSYDLMAEQNLAELTYKKYALPLSNSTDLKITHNDTDIISGTGPYAGMSITYYGSTQSRTIGSTDYDFKIIIDGDNGTAEQIYEFVQYQLRQNSDIDAGAGSEIGKISDELLIFIGDTLRTTGPVDTGVFIENFSSIDTNRLEFTDYLGNIVTFPYVAAGTLQFNDNLINDDSSLYWIFFTDAYDSSAAIIMKNKDGIPITGSVTQAIITFDYDYDGNVQGGRTGGTDAPYTAVAIGLETGQYVKTTGTINRSTSNVINFVAALERNYSNPL